MLQPFEGCLGRPTGALSLALGLATMCITVDASAVPAFARQTGQNCVACHAGGQFPELTPYGRIFKLTGYTLGTRGLPLSAMAVGTYTRTRNTDTVNTNPAANPGGTTNPNGVPTADFPKNGNLIANTGSVFLAGKVTDNIGGFVQMSYDNYSSQSAVDNHWQGHSHSDNLDIRYADRFIDPSSDLIVGLSFNNNPSVQDVFNSAPAWGFNVVPGSTGAGPGVPSPLLAGGLSQQVVGLGAYAYWNKTVYAELSFYRTADKAFSFASQGFNTAKGNQTALRGLNPYFRVALTREWGAHNAMVGLMGLSADVYPDPTVPTGPVDKYRDIGLDAQYQYLLDPHTVTAQMSYVRERRTYASASQCGAVDQNAADPFDPTGASTYCGTGNTLQAAPNAADTLKVFRAKLSYVYQAKYGSSLSFFDVRGSVSSALQTSAYDTTNGLQAVTPGIGGNVLNASGNPATRGWTGELFWTPVQYARVGMQYTLFSKFNGASENYDGFGRNARDNNTLLFYVWGAY